MILYQIWRVGTPQIKNIRKRGRGLLIGSSGVLQSLTKKVGGSV
jgi:hypothetical protein